MRDGVKNQKPMKNGMKYKLPSSQSCDQDLCQKWESRWAQMDQEMDVHMH